MSELLDIAAAVNRLLRAEKPDCRVMVGGAVLNQEYADMIGADFYGKDAMQSVRYAQEFFSGRAGVDKPAKPLYN